MIPETIQEILDLYPFVGVYRKNKSNQQLIIRKENLRVTIPKDLRLILQERRKLDYMLLDMILADSEEKVDSNDLKLEIQQRNIVLDFELDKFLLYVTNEEKFGVSYVSITDVPLQLGINPNETNAQTTDPQGRIFIGDCAEKAGLEREIVFFGAENHIRIYSVANWERYKAK